MRTAHPSNPNGETRSQRLMLAVTTIGFVVNFWAWGLLSRVAPPVREQGSIGGLIESDPRRPGPRRQTGAQRRSPPGALPLLTARVAHRDLAAAIPAFDADAPDFPPWCRTFLDDLAVHGEREDLGTFPASVVTLGATGCTIVDEAHTTSPSFLHDQVI